MKVLVTGGAGYIGCHAVRELRERDTTSRSSTTSREGHRASMPEASPLVEGDLGDPQRSAAWRSTGVDAVLHFAGLLTWRESVRDPASYYQNNVVKGLALLRGDAGGRGRADHLQLDLRRLRHRPCASRWTRTIPRTRSTPTARPSSPSSARCSTTRGRASVRAVALRYFNAAGAHPDGSLGEDHRPEKHLIPLALDAALGSTARAHDLRRRLRDARRHLHPRLHPRPGPGPGPRAGPRADWTRGSPARPSTSAPGRAHSVREVIESVGRVSGRAVPARVGPRRPGDPPRLVASAERIRETLGFRPEHVELDDDRRVRLALAAGPSRGLRGAVDDEASPHTSAGPAAHGGDARLQRAGDGRGDHRPGAGRARDGAS